MKKKLERMARKWVRELAELKRRAARVRNRIAQLQKQVKWADAQLEAKSCVGVLCCAAGKKTSGEREIPQLTRTAAELDAQIAYLDQRLAALNKVITDAEAFQRVQQANEALRDG